MDNWGSISQDRILGGGDAHRELVLKEGVLVNCGGEP